MLKLERFKLCKLLQLIKIFCIVVTFPVSKLETFTVCNAEQLLNIYCIFSTLEVSKLDKSNDLKLLQFINIEYIELTLVVIIADKFNSVNAVQPLNIYLTLVRTGVLKLVNISKEKARSVNPNIELGVCGEHAGDKDSIYNFDKVGLDYVSCSAYRIPAAILSSAQSSILEKSNN